MGEGRGEGDGAWQGCPLTLTLSHKGRGNFMASQRQIANRKAESMGADRVHWSAKYLF
jgi:hypothetical protein